jgi:hypothetical protein
LEHKAWDQAWQAEVWINTGGTAWTPGPDEETVRAVLSELAVPDTWITAQVHYALTGRTCAPSDHPGPPR